MKIGVLASTSGALSSFGFELQKAVRLAQEQVNAAGGVFDGRPLELVVVDTGSDPATAAGLATKLVDEGVVAFIGPETSGQADAVLDVAILHELPMVSCCATSADLSGRNSASSGFFFRTAPSDVLQGEALAFVAKNGVNDATAGVAFPACPQVAFFARPDSYGVGFQEEFTTHYAGETVGADVAAIVATGTFANEDPSQAEVDDAAADFLTAINASADPTEELCIVFVTFGFEGARLIGQLEESLVTGTLDYHYLTGDGAQESAFLQELDVNAPDSVRAKLIGTVPFHAISPAFDQFSTAFSARHAVAPSAYCAQAFDSMFITALAVSKARSTVGKDVRNALFAVSGREGGVKFDGGNFFGEIAAQLLEGDDVDYIGPSGDLTFDAVGDVQGDYVLWQVGETDGALTFQDKVPLPVVTFHPL
ncbi:MAG: ABC transporter substrate-binding protein [Deltaproteobacteria bacterium]|nr:ABC transporter substrate-binding protein [Deltaproteobacteria bacterium]